MPSIECCEISSMCLAGATISEGGFKKDQVSAASLIASDQEQKDGRTYYKLQVLTRTGEEWCYIDAM